MAAPTESKVAVGAPKIGGAIFRAPVGTALPTDESTALDAAFINQGYVSSDGFTRAINKAYATINAWGGDEVAKSRTELSVSAEFALIQTLDADVIESVFGTDAVTVTPADISSGEKIAVAYAGAELPKSLWVVELAYNGRARRIVFPNSQVTTEDFSQEFTDEDVAAFPVELTSYRDGSGNFFYDYSNDGVTTA